MSCYKRDEAGLHHIYDLKPGRTFVISGYHTGDFIGKIKRRHFLLVEMEVLHVLSGPLQIENVVDVDWTTATFTPTGEREEPVGVS